MKTAPDECVRSAKESSRIRDLEQALGQWVDSAEHDFLEVGETLSSSVAVLGRLSEGLGRLADRLESDDADRAILQLQQAMDRIRRLPAAHHDIDRLLQRLDEQVAQIAKSLAGLGRIIGEIRSLAINGKIQVAQLHAGEVDFSVFTNEIGRLGRLAERSLNQAESRLEAVGTAVASARRAAREFEQDEALELEAVRRRIGDSLAVLADRQRRAALAATAAATKSKLVAQRTADVVGMLQINDNVCQRIDHVRRGLRAAAVLAVGELFAEDGWDGVRDLPAEARADTVTGLCGLVLAQLAGAAEDYVHDVEGLICNLQALGGDARDIRSEADVAFGDEQDGLFVARIENDVERAATLLAAYAAERERTRSVERAVSEGFQAMEEDLAAIRSIDADMRIMGLNATLKCGRLGTEGRALGVVAQELRACSRRTEDSANAIASLLRDSLTLADSFAAAATAGGDGDDMVPLDIVAASLASLSALGSSMSDALAGLRGDAGGVAAALTAAAGGIDLHRRLERLAVQETGPVAAMAGASAAARLDEAAHREIGRLMQPLYTMERERAIHQAFAGGYAVALAPPPLQSEDDVDSLFF